MAALKNFTKIQKMIYLRSSSRHDPTMKKKTFLACYKSKRIETPSIPVTVIVMLKSKTLIFLLEKSKL